MGKVLRSVAEENADRITNASNQYLEGLYATMLNPDMPMRYNPPRRDISRKVPFRKFFHYF